MEERSIWVDMQAQKEGTHTRGYTFRERIGGGGVNGPGGGNADKLKGVSVLKDTVPQREAGYDRHVAHA